MKRLMLDPPARRAAEAHACAGPRGPVRLAEVLDASAGVGWRSLTVLALALLPKCPACAAVYLGGLSVFGISVSDYSGPLSALLLAAGFATMVFVMVAGLRSGRWLPGVLMAVGFAVLLGHRFFLETAGWQWVGFAAFFSGCLLHAVLRRAAPHRACVPCASARKR